MINNHTNEQINLTAPTKADALIKNEYATNIAEVRYALAAKSFISTSQLLTVRSSSAAAAVPNRKSHPRPRRSTLCIFLTLFRRDI